MSEDGDLVWGAGEEWVTCPFCFTQQGSIWVWRMANRQVKREPGGVVSQTCANEACGLQFQVVTPRETIPDVGLARVFREADMELAQVVRVAEIADAARSPAEAERAILAEVPAAAPVIKEAKKQPGWLKRVAATAGAIVTFAGGVAGVYGEVKPDPPASKPSVVVIERTSQLSDEQLVRIDQIARDEEERLRHRERDKAAKKRYGRER